MAPLRKQAAEYPLRALGLWIIAVAGSFYLVLLIAAGFTGLGVQVLAAVWMGVQSLWYREPKYARSMRYRDLTWLVAFLVLMFAAVFAARRLGWHPSREDIALGAQVIALLLIGVTIAYYTVLPRIRRAS